MECSKALLIINGIGGIKTVIWLMKKHISVAFHHRMKQTRGFQYDFT
jgi:hypothetical protein